MGMEFGGTYLAAALADEGARGPDRLYRRSDQERILTPF
jgi:hypothetical protein